MKKVLASIALCSVLVCACKTTPPDRVVFNTIGSVEQTASAAVDSYFASVARGISSTNDVPKVAFAWNQLRADCLLAATVAQNGTNALAPDVINTELNQLTAVIITATKH